MKIAYKKADIADAALLVKLYNAAFFDDFVRYGECPAYGRTVHDMEKSIENYPKYIIMCEEKPVGVISFQSRGGEVYYLGCLCAVPEFQGRGIGTQAVEFLLSQCADWSEISLITPADKEQNVRFYTWRCGFEIAGRIMDGNVEVVELVKRRGE